MICLYPVRIRICSRCGSMPDIHFPVQTALIQPVFFLRISLIVQSAFHTAPVYKFASTQITAFPPEHRLPLSISSARPAAVRKNLLYGSSLLISLGKSVVSRTLSSPTSFMVRRSRPIPSPPCGGIPCLNALRYCSIPSSVIPRFSIFSSS